MSRTKALAVLARVSTKRQEEKGESLDKQKRDLRKAVERYGGAVVRDYSGQESATSGKVRPRFEQMLGDAQRGLFDAVIVREGSRWARNTRSTNSAAAWRIPRSSQSCRPSRTRGQ